MFVAERCLSNKRRVRRPDFILYFADKGHLNGEQKNNVGRSESLQFMRGSHISCKKGLEKPAP
jgi:hypothetical protein